METPFIEEEVGRQYRTVSEHEKGIKFSDLHTSVGSDASGKRTHLRIIAKRLHYAAWFSFLYVFMFLAQVGLLVWGGLQHYYVHNIQEAVPESGWYVALDVAIIMVLCVEVMIRLLATPNYFKRWLNWADMCVAVLSVCGLLLYAFDIASALWGSIVTCTRYLLMMFRLSTAMRHWCKQKQIMLTSDATLIDFASLDVGHTNEDMGDFFEAETSDRTPGPRGVYGHAKQVDLLSLEHRRELGNDSHLRE